MNKRPLSVTLVGGLFIIVGIFGIVYHATEINPANPIDVDLFSALFVRFLAIVGGIFLIRGTNWARWLIIGWMGYHVILSTSQSVIQLITHVVILVGVAYLLYRPQAAGYFGRQDAK